MANPIGVTFMPSNENQQMGPQRGSIEGPGGDLGAAFKILSLHLPRVLGAQALSPEALLKSKGAAGVAAPAGANPYSAVFEALLKAMNGGASSYLPPSQSPSMPSSMPAPASFGQSSYRPPSAAQPEPSYPSAPAPRITPADRPGQGGAPQPEDPHNPRAGGAVVEEPVYVPPPSRPPVTDRREWLFNRQSY